MPGRARAPLVSALALALMLVRAATSSAHAAELPSSQERPALVVAVRDPEATQAFEARGDRVRAMVDRAITNLTGKPSVEAAWLSLVRTQDVVGIKVYSLPGPTVGTRPSVAAAVVEGLLAAGLPPGQIIIWDRQAADLRQAGFFELARRYGIRVEGSADAGYDESTEPYDKPWPGRLVWGDLEFGLNTNGIGRKSYVSKLLSRRITKIINISPMLNHNLAGVCGNLYSLAFGSVDNVLRFESDAEVMTEAIPEIYAKEEIGDRVVLSITDGLVCQYQGEDRVRLPYSIALNELRFSTDPVALDVLSLEELDRQREAAHLPAMTPNRKIYTVAGLLGLGTCDLKHILVVRIP